MLKGKDHVHMKFTNFKTNMLYESKNLIKKINFHFSTPKIVFEIKANLNFPCLWKRLLPADTRRHKVGLFTSEKEVHRVRQNIVKVF